MSLKVGTLVEMTRDAPYKEYHVYKGDIGVINYVALTKKYSIHIYGKTNPHNDSDRKYGNHGDFWIPFDYVKEYSYKSGDRVEIISKTSKYKGHQATVYCEKKGFGHCSDSICLFVDGTDYQPSAFHNKYLMLVKSSVKPININNKEGENNMKLSGFDKVAVIEISGKDYHYALYDDDIVAGDTVLVPGEYVTENKLYDVKEVITVDEAKERFSKDIISEVKCKVDLSAYNQRVEDRKEKEKLRKKMEEEIKKMDEINKYEMYADRNPALKEMLEQFKNLNV